MSDFLIRMWKRPHFPSPFYQEQVKGTCFFQQSGPKTDHFQYFLRIYYAGCASSELLIVDEKPRLLRHTLSTIKFAELEQDKSPSF